MAAAQILKTAHNIEKKITQVIDGERRASSFPMRHSKSICIDGKEAKVMAKDAKAILQQAVISVDNVKGL
jgi:hypothetical protein